MFNAPFNIKKLDFVELWLSNIRGSVNLTVYWKVDGTPLWNQMTSGTVCAEPLGETQKRTKIRFTVPEPVGNAKEEDQLNLDRGYAFEFCIQWQGFCRIERARFRPKLESKEDFRLACNTSDECTLLEPSAERVLINPFDYSILGGN